MSHRRDRKILRLKMEKMTTIKTMAEKAMVAAAEPETTMGTTAIRIILHMEEL